MSGEPSSSPPGGSIGEPSQVEERLRAATDLLENKRFDAATTEAREAGELARAAGDDTGLARAENLLGLIAWGRGRWEDAGRWFGAAREHAEAAGDTALLLWIESNDAAVQADLGQGELARESLNAALPRLSLVGEHPEALRILHNLGRVLGAVDQLAAADGLLTRAMTIAKREADTAAGMALVIERARLALGHGDVVRADALLGTVSALADRVESASLRADSACLEGEVLRIAGRPAAAERALLMALELAEEGGAVPEAARAWRELGELEAARGRTVEALRALDAARHLFTQLGARPRASEAARRAAEIGACAPDPPPAGPVAPPKEQS